jgi:hypothetical protein
MGGKCPKCDKILASVTIKQVDAINASGKSFHGVSYVCPFCDVALSVSIDPIAVAGDSVKKTIDRIGKLLRRE